MDTTIDLAADPYEFTLAPEHCALLIIDAQRDFLEPGGFGEMLGYDVSQLRRTIEPNRGYDCLVLEDCVGFYLPEFHDMGLAGWKRQLAGEGQRQTVVRRKILSLRHFRALSALEPQPPRRRPRS